MLPYLRQRFFASFILTAFAVSLVHCGNPQKFDNIQAKNEDAMDEGGVRLETRIGNHHPLDPLDAVEMRLVGTLIQHYNRSSNWQFKFIGLREPDKDIMYPYFLTQTVPPLRLIPRRANVLIADPVLRRPIWVVVNLSSFQIESWTEGGPEERVSTITVEDNDLSIAIAFADPRVIQRLKALGYNGPSDVTAETWDAGYVADNPTYSHARKLIQIYLYGYRATGTNYWSHPIDFIVVVELGPNVVRGIEPLPIQKDFDITNRTGNSVPQTEYNYLSETLPPNSIRRGLRPIQISQPEGASYKISGREVSWQNFKFRIGYNLREGPHFYTVSYTDNEVIRPIAYRISLSEIFLRYADPRPPYHRKMTRDEEMWGYGASSFALPLHEFCRGNAYYFGSDFHNEKAETWTVQNTICVVEEDAGLLWAQWDPVTTKTAAVRNQRLAISHATAVDFTLYWVTWRFYEDGGIELAIKITGTLTTNLMAVDVKAPDYGTLLAPQLYTQIYQHFFAVRIDADIDGRNNTVSIEDIVRVTETSKPQNPYGTGLRLQSTVLRTAGESPSENLPTRSWKISNDDHIEPINGKPVGWKLVPQGPNPSVPNLLTPDSPVRGLTPWADHKTWVLPYNPDQIFAGGRNIKYEGALDEGVAAWTKQNPSANLVDTDVVLWHVAGYTCAPEIEDWPVVSGCPAEFGFKLKPSGFFKENPALRSPPASEMTRLDGKPCGGGSAPSGSGWTQIPSLPTSGWLGLKP